MIHRKQNDPDVCSVALSSERKTEFIGNDFADIAACEVQDPRQNTCKVDEEHITKR